MRYIREQHLCNALSHGLLQTKVEKLVAVAQSGKDSQEGIWESAGVPILLQRHGLPRTEVEWKSKALQDTFAARIWGLS